MTLINRRQILPATLAMASLFTLSGKSAHAEDRLKIATGEGSTYDTGVVTLGSRAGIFAKHGIALDILFTQGGGETMQAVIAGSVDIAMAVGTVGVLGAFSKGAPLRIISAQETGAQDFYWYVPANSPIKSIHDISGRTVAYSTNGSSTYAVALGFAQQFNVTPKLVATGAVPATYAATMSGQIDVGWAAAPFGLADRKSGKIRVLAFGNEVGDIRNQTIRVNVVLASALDQKGPLIERFLKAYDEVIDWMYDSPDAVKAFAEMSGVPIDIALETRDHYTLKPALQAHELRAIDLSIKDALRFKVLTAPPSEEQLSTLIKMKRT